MPSRPEYEEQEPRVEFAGEFKIDLQKEKQDIERLIQKEETRLKELSFREKRELREALARHNDEVAAEEAPSSFDLST